MRGRRVAVEIEPTGRNVAYLCKSELNQGYRIVPKTKAEGWWVNEQNKIPAFESRTLHILSGALLPIWKDLKTLSRDALNIVRTTTDDGTRLVGVKISEEWLRDIRQHFGLRASLPTTANEVLLVVDFEKNSVMTINAKTQIYQSVSFTRMELNIVQNVAGIKFGVGPALRQSGQARHIDHF